MSELKDPHLTAAMHAMTDDLDGLKRHLLERIDRRDGEALGEAQAALQSHPSDPELLLMAALTALFAERPELSLRYEHRFSKRFRPIEAEGALLRAIALAQQERWAQAAQILKQYGSRTLHGSFLYLPGDWSLRTWVHNWLNKIERAEKRRAAAVTPAPKRVKNLAATSTRSNKASKGEKRGRAAAPDKEANASAISADAAALQSQTTTSEPVKESPPLPRIEARIPVAVTLPESFDLTPAESAGGASAADELTAFRLRYELSHLGLLQGFDELLCLPALHNVDAYWYR